MFGFVAQGENGSKWNSAVKEVKQVSEGPVGVRIRYRMLRELPSGKVENTYEIIEIDYLKTLTVISIMLLVDTEPLLGLGRSLIIKVPPLDRIYPEMSRSPDIRPSCRGPMT